VKAFTRALCVAFVMMGMLGVMGCGPDNESEGAKASQKLGDPGKPVNEPTEAQKAVTLPRTNAERSKMGPQGSILQQSKAATAPAADKKK